MTRWLVVAGTVWVFALACYRCSDMVYSPAFAALPGAARTAVIARMNDIPAARTDSAASEILSETVAGWQ